MERYLYFSAVSFAIVSIAFCVLAGDLAPPAGAIKDGQPVSIMKTLNQIEPRTLIDSLPFAITNSGSYYLVQTLLGTNGITITEDDVVLDLGGFSLEGMTNSGHGITIGEDVLDVTIKNGAVDEWGGWGIFGTNADHFQIINMSFEFNQQGGLRLGDQCKVLDCNATKNGGPAIDVGENCTVKDCKTKDNSGNGIMVRQASTVVSCSAVRNGQNGITADIYCTVRDCTIFNNTNHGIEASASCRIESNNIGDNGRGTGGAGIFAVGPGNRIKSNNVTANEDGIRADNAGNWIEGNSLIDNTRGLRMSGSANLVIRNVVGTPLATNAVAHFDITGPSNQVAEILQNLGGTFTNSNPWANIRLTPKP